VSTVCGVSGAEPPKEDAIMTLSEWKTAVLYEARTLRHVEARTIIKTKAARALVAEGKLVDRGTIGGVRLKNGERAHWYTLPAEPRGDF
jgi:hypothetical protein